MNIHSVKVIGSFPKTQNGDMSKDVNFGMPVPPAHANSESPGISIVDLQRPLHIKNVSKVEI
jgi:hypothetical protein